MPEKCKNYLQRFSKDIKTEHLAAAGVEREEAEGWFQQALGAYKEESGLKLF